MCNLHGNRINHDFLERRGSGYMAHHAADFLMAHDPWFRGLALQYGPDGGVFLSDWTDTGECHNYVEVDRTNGRLYKITYGKVTPYHEDLSKLTAAELVQRQLNPNDWHVRHARRILHERMAAGKLSPSVHDQLRSLLQQNPDATRKLRALWCLYVTGGLDEALLSQLLDHPEETIRGWAIRLALDNGHPSKPIVSRLSAMAKADSSPWVRLALASGLQRLPLEERWPLAEGLVSHAEDATDTYLPLMIWYGIEPLVSTNCERAAGLLARAKIPLEREYLARRMVYLDHPPSTGLTVLVTMLKAAHDPEVQRDVLHGVLEALRGRRQVAMPEGWPAAYARLTASSHAEVLNQARRLAVLFGDARAIALLRDLLLDGTAAVAERDSALQTFLSIKRPDLVPLLHQLVAEGALRGPAIRALAAYSDPNTSKVILSHYASLSESDKSDAIQTLASRPSYALALLNAMEKGQVARRDISAFTIRQLLALNQPAINDKLAKVWGTIRPAAKDKAVLMARYKALLTPDFLKGADRSQGRSVYGRICASCHRLFDAGGNVGPDLTGSQRFNLDYVLDNVLDPSAMVPKEYQVTLLETRDGRLLTGIIKQENDRSLTVQTQNEIVIVPTNEIESRKASPLSMMPEGLFDKLRPEEIRDLVGYLASPAQVPLPKGLR
jgi:putative heme-binding domain-containing protein